jgi:hypothetical protein
MAIGCGLTSVRGNKGKNYENEPLVSQKHTKKKKGLPVLKTKNHIFRTSLGHPGEQSCIL